MSDKSTLSPELAIKLRTLAAAATMLCCIADSAELMDASDADDHRSRSDDACEDFFDLANAQLTDEQDMELTQRCHKANTQEQIQHTLDVLGIIRE
jgi:hypothetical protein